MCYGDEGGIKKITISGNKNYNSYYYSDLIDDNIGTNYSGDTKNDIEKTIFGTSNIEHVNVSHNNNSKTVNVDIGEKQLVRKLVFVGDGSKDLKEDFLKENIKIKVGRIFSDKYLFEDRVTLYNFYKAQGYFHAEISPEINYPDDNSVEITFNISRKKKARVRKIYFAGNKSFSDKKLKDEIFSRENRFYRFGKPINYDPDVIEYDMYLLDQFYQSNGFFDVKILPANAIADEKSGNFDIIYTIEENQKYIFGNISVEDHVKKAEKNEINDVIEKIKRGDVFDRSLVREVMDGLNNLFIKRGYLLVHISPRFIKSDNGAIDIVFEILHGRDSDRKYIGKIDITGNSKTRDYVIRQQMNITEGNQFNDFLLRDSMRKVRNLGFFEQVSYEEKDETTTNQKNSGGFKRIHSDKERKILKNQKDVEITVVEGSTGFFSLSGGYSSMDSFYGNLEYSERNLLGRAIFWNTGFRVSKSSKTLNLDFSKPELFATKITGGFGFTFNDERNTQNKNLNFGFDEYLAGVNGFISMDVTDYLEQKFAYRYEYKRITRTENRNPEIFPEHSTKTSEISSSSIYDKRNSRYGATRGYVASLDVALAGLGGNKDYIRAVGHLATYYPLYLNKIVFKLETRIGFIKSLNSNPLYMVDGFYLGGHRMRGFEHGGIGPRIKQANDEYSTIGLGGTRMYYFNSEIKFPIFSSKELSIHGILFLNLGTVTGFEKRDFYSHGDVKSIEDSGKFRSATGVSIVFRPVQLAEITFDFSRILRKESYDRPREFNFDISMVTRF
ncbi:MAG: outer membrane protein assembly factor BamA [Rickettsiales bacterium]|nr:outer membrane protein assembly factor BamA [Rickettsiales bacterium]